MVSLGVSSFQLSVQPERRLLVLDTSSPVVNTGSSSSKAAFRFDSVKELEEVQRVRVFLRIY